MERENILGGGDEMDSFGERRHKHVCVMCVRRCHLVELSGPKSRISLSILGGVRERK